MAIVFGTDNSETIHEIDGVTDEADTIYGLGGDDDIYGLGGDDEIFGGEGTDHIFGGDGDDTISGGSEGDFIDGGEGADDMDGGSGLDTALYTTSAFAIIVNLAAGQGQGGDAQGDTYTSVENVAGSAFADTITGNDGNNSLIGHDGNDTLRGGLGTDTLNGEDGEDTASYGDSLSGVIVDLGTGAGAGGTAENDTLANIEHLAGSQFDDGLIGDAGANVLTGASGADTLIGNGGADTLMGDAGADTLKGGGGADVLNGGSGTDTASYSGSLTGVVVSLATGLGAYGDADGDVLSDVDNLAGSAHPDSLFGDDGANTLYGLDGDDTLNGGSGSDTFVGGVGNDTMQGDLGDDWFYVDAAADGVLEVNGQGSDRVLASVSYTLAAGQAIEKLTTADNSGLAAINLTGNNFANVVYGNAGANVIDGKGGVDTLVGLGGDDWFYVDNGLDVVLEGVGEGSDRVLSATSYTLAAGQEIEKLTTDNNAGVGAINLTGNELNNLIYGNSGSNALKGGLGADTLVGLGGADAFSFNSALGGGNIDAISDYNVTDDSFVLASWIFSGLAVGTLAAGEFRTGAAAADADDHVIYNSATGAVLFDADGTGATAAVQFAILSAGLAVTNADFIVV